MCVWGGGGGGGGGWGEAVYHMHYSNISAKEEIMRGGDLSSDLLILFPLTQSRGVASSKMLLRLLYKLLACRSRTAPSKTGSSAD